MTTDAAQDNSLKKMTVEEPCYFIFVLLHSILLGVNLCSVHATIQNSPASPTFEGVTEWEMCAPLGVWSVSWRFILNICCVLFAVSSFAGGKRACFRIVAHSMLMYGAWFMAGPFFLYNYAAQCASSAPDLLRGALESYALFTLYAFFMMFLFSIAAFEGVRKVRPTIKARKKAEANAKAAQAAALETISEKAPIQAVPEGQLVDVRVEELV